MTDLTDRPKIYHITHVDNLADIIGDTGLVSDRVMFERGGPTQAIGMSEIKRRRLEELNVTCHSGTKVGDYVPFYFCPRSVMLYVIFRSNDPELKYRGGQEPIIHMEADLFKVIRWAEDERKRWAFSLTNAGAYYSEFYAHINELSQLDWAAIKAEDFRDPAVKEKKQAEFLLHEQFPFDLVERIGVRSTTIKRQTDDAVRNSNYRPAIEIKPAWYF